MATANTFGLGNVDLYPLGVSDRQRTATIGELNQRVRANYGARALEDVAGEVGLPCPVVRLDEFLARRAPRPRLVKIDVEGMEEAVVRGMSGLLHEGLVISAEADRQDRVPGLFAALDALNCSKYAVFGRAVSSGNPHFDRHKAKCRVRHVHVLGFAGRPPAWLTEQAGIWSIDTVSDFEMLAAKYFKGRHAEVELPG